MRKKSGKILFLLILKKQIGEDLQNENLQLKGKFFKQSLEVCLEMQSSLDEHIFTVPMKVNTHRTLKTF